MRTYIVTVTTIQYSTSTQGTIKQKEANFLIRMGTAMSKNTLKCKMIDSAETECIPLKYIQQSLIWISPRMVLLYVVAYCLWCA